MGKYSQLFLSLLPKCKTLDSFKRIHAQVIQYGLHADYFVAGKLLFHCCIKLSDALNHAFCIWNSTPNPDVFMCNTLVRGFAESDSPEKSLQVFVHMLRKSNFLPDSFSFAFALKGAANSKCLRSGSQLHSQAFLRGLSSHVFVGTTLVSTYGECGMVRMSRTAFDEMPEPNVVAWNALLTAHIRCNDLMGAERILNSMPFRDLTTMNSMLAGYTKAGKLDLAKELFSGMLVKDDVSWSTMIFGLSLAGNYEESFCYFRELLRLGLTPNQVSLSQILSTCAQTGASEFGEALHGLIEKLGLGWIPSVNNALLDAYSKCGKLDMAYLFFERMPIKKNIVSWTSMITGLATQGYGSEAISLFHKMKEFGIAPDDITFVSILNACSHTGLIEQGENFFSMMSNEFGIEPTIEHYGCMVDLYGRAGQLQKAYDIIIHMPISSTAIIWRTLLSACSLHGNVEIAEIANERLAELDPANPSNCVLLSNIYAHSGKQKHVVSTRQSMAALNLRKVPGWSTI